MVWPPRVGQVADGLGQLAGCLAGWLAVGLVRYVLAERQAGYLLVGWHAGWLAGLLVTI